MLILTRRVGETEIIEVPPSTETTRIDITVLGVKGNQVRLGTNAPKHVSVDREEIYQRKQQENQNHAERQFQSRQGQAGDRGELEGGPRPLGLR